MGNDFNLEGYILLLVGNKHIRKCMRNILDMADALDGYADTADRQKIKELAAL